MVESSLEFLKPQANEVNYRQPLQVQLRTRVTCPHCWTEFAPDEVLWISQHTDLQGDPLLGGDEQERFFPSRFDVNGKAIDVKGVPCRDLACPNCHLSISWSLLEMRPLFISILGSPASGKSYFLASMTWQLQQTLQDKFHIKFADADPVANRILNGYEEVLFLNSDDDQLVALPKTEQQGDLYQSVQFGERVVWYPRPFVFSLQPVGAHPDVDKTRLLSRALCLYDNAGEQFLPGGETAGTPADHLSLSEVLLFLFDPTQHPKFRKACGGGSRDPQMGQHGRRHRQDRVLLEAARRIRIQSGLPQDAKYPRTLIVVVTKFDTWSTLLNKKKLQLHEVVREVGGQLAALDIEALREVSNRVREIIWKHAREVVSAAEGFCDDVMYIPVSAFGRNAELMEESVNDDGTRALGIRPRDIRPMWTEVPMLLALNRSTERLVRTAVRVDGPKQPQGDPSDSSPPAGLSGQMEETGS